MGLLRQFGQLLWKNLILRKREPHVLLLEIAWPLVIFLLVALMRSSTGPVKRDTCSYEDRSLPSAGMLPFIQSTVCNLDNKCSPREVAEKRTASAAKLTSTVQQLEPILQNTQTLDAMEVGVKLVNTLNKVNLTSVDIKDAENFQIRNLLKNPEEVKRVLVEEMHLLSSTIADDLLNASINVLELLDHLNEINNMYDVFCDVENMTKVMIFPMEADLNRISQEVCSIPTANLMEIANFLLHQLDIEATIRAARFLTTLGTQDYNLNAALSDLADFAGLLQKTSLGGQLQVLGNIQQSFASLSQISALLEQMPNLNAQSVSSLLNTVDPLMPIFGHNATIIWPELKKEITQFISELSALQENPSNVNFTVLHRALAALQDKMDNDTKMIVESMTKLTGLINYFMNSNESNYEHMIENLTNIVTQSLPYADPFVSPMLDKIVELALLVTEFVEDVNKAIDDVITTAQNSMNALLDHWDEDVFNVLTSMNLLEAASKGESIYKAKCAQMMTEINVQSQHIDSLCSGDVLIFSDSYHWLKPSFRIELADIISSIDNILNGTGPVMVPDQAKMKQNIEKIVASIEKQKDRVYDHEDVRDSLAKQSWIALADMGGKMLENTTILWPVASPFLKTASTLMDMMITNMETMKKMSNMSSDMAQSIQYLVNYSPEILSALLLPNVNSTAVTKAIMTQTDFSPSALFCDMRLMSTLGLPDNVPVSDIDAAMCRTDWSSVMGAMTTMFDASAMWNKIEANFNDSYSTRMDWSGMINDMYTMKNIMSEQNVSMTMYGPIYIVMQSNFTRIQDAMNTMMDKMQQMSLSDLYSYLGNDFVKSMESLDKVAANESFWRMAQHYVLTWTSLAKFSTKLINLNNHGSLFDLQEYMKKFSPTFAELMANATKKIPHLLEASVNITNKPVMLFVKILNMDLKNICDGQQLVNILNLPANHPLSSFEKELCTLDWSQVVSEISQQNPDFNEYMRLVETLGSNYYNLSMVFVNWTETVTVTRDWLEAMMSNNSMPFTSWDSLAGFDLNMINMTWQNFVITLSTAEAWNPTSLSHQADELLDVLGSKFSEMDDNNTAVQFLQTMQTTQQILMYQIDSLLKFALIHLDYLNKTYYINLEEYLQSSQFSKFVQMVESTPDLLDIVLANLVDETGFGKAINLFSNIGGLCQNDTDPNSWMVIPLGSSMNANDVRTLICQQIDFELMLQELLTKVQGFSDLMQTTDLLTSGKFNSSTMYANFSLITSKMQEISSYLEDLSSSPVMVTLGNSNDWMNSTLYMMKLQTFATQVASLVSPIASKTFGNFFPQYNTTDEWWTLMNIVANLDQGMNGTTGNSLINYYVKTGKLVVDMLNGIITKMSAGSGNKVQISHLFKNSTYISLLLAGLNGSDTDVIQRLMTGYIKPEKYGAFLALVMDPEQLSSFFCSQTLMEELLELPASLDAKRLSSALCNVTTTDVMNDLIDQFDLTSLLQQIEKYNDTESVNIQEVLKSIEQLVDTLMKTLNMSTTDLWSGVINPNQFSDSNSSLISEVLNEELKKMQTMLPLVAQILDSNLNPILAEARDSGYTVVMVLAITSSWLDTFTQHVISNEPVSLTDLFGDGDLTSLFSEIFDNHDWLTELTNVKLDPQKFENMIQADNITSMLCSKDFFEVFTTTGNLTLLSHMQEYLCQSNGTAILTDVLNSLIKDHKVSQQMTALLMELQMGKAALNITQNSLEAFQKLMDFLTVLQGGNLNTTLDIGAFQTAFTQLFYNLTGNPDAFVMQWLPMIYKVAGLDANLPKSFKMLAAILTVVNQRIEFIQGGINTTSLLKNSTNAMEYLSSVFNVVRGGSTMLMENNIFVDILLDFIMNPAKMTQACQNKELFKTLVANGMNESLAEDFVKVICQNSSELLDMLSEQADIGSLSAGFKDLLNVNVTYEMDWEYFNSQLLTFINHISSLMENLPAMDPNIFMIQDFEKVLSMWNSYQFDPEKFMQDLYGPLNIPLPSEYYPFTAAWGKFYTVMSQALQQAQNGTIDSSPLLALFNSLSDPSMYVEQYNRFWLERAGNSSKFRQFICQGNDYHTWQVYDYLGNSVTFNLSKVLCDKPADMWYNLLKNDAPSSYYFEALLDTMYRVSLNVTGEDFKAVPMVTVSEIVQQMTNLYRWMSVTDSPILEQLFMSFFKSSDSAALASIDSGLFFLKMANDRFENQEIEGFLNFLNVFNKYLTSQIKILQASEKGIPLNILLPNSTLISQLLVEVLGGNSAASFLTAVVAPDKFMTLTFTFKWKDVVCNSSVFMDTFTFPNGTNVAAIQADLCVDAQKQDSIIMELLQKLNVTDVANALMSWLQGQTKSQQYSNTSIWDAVKSSTGEFVQNLILLQNFTDQMEGLDLWASPILKALESLNKMNSARITETCDSLFSYIGGTDLYKNNFREILVGITNNIAQTKYQIKLQSAMEKIMCDLAADPESDLLSVVNKNNFTQILSKLLNVNTNVEGAVSCSGVVESVAELSTVSLSANSSHCWNYFGDAVSRLFGDATKTLQTGQALLQMMSKPELQGLLANAEIYPIMQYIMNVYQKQEQVTMKLADVLSAEKSFAEYLQSALTMAPEVISVFLNSTVDRDFMALWNMSSSEITTVICDPDILKKTIKLPFSETVSYGNISSLLCTGDVNNTIYILKQAFNADLMKALMESDLTKLTAWSPIYVHMADLFRSISALSDFDFTLFDVTLDNLNPEIISKLQYVLFHHGTDQLVKRLNLLLEDFRQLDPSPEAQNVISDVQIVASGIASLRIVSTYFPPSLILSDVIKNKDAVTAKLAQYGISVEVSTSLLESAIYYKELSQYNPEELKELICDEEKLNDVINMSRSSVADVSASFCTLSDSQIANITSIIFENIDLMELLTKFVGTENLDILKEQTLTKSEVQTALDTLAGAQDDLTRTAQLFENSSAELNFQAFSNPEALTESQFLGTFSEVFCGRGDEISLQDMTGLSSVSRPIEELSEDQTAEMNSLPGQFCKDMYKDILKRQNGPIIWTFLKPLLRGKVLYTPKTPAVDNLMQVMYNNSFGMIKDVQTLAKKWSKGFQNLEQLTNSNSFTKDLDSMLANPTAARLISTFLGISSSSLTSGLQSIDSIPSDKLKVLQKISQLAENYSSCLETDRLVGYDTEAEVEKAALDYSKSNNLLGAIVFNNIPSGSRKKRAANDQLPKHISYKIRMDIEFVRHTIKNKDMFWEPSPQDRIFDLRYLQGFMQLQDFLDKAIIYVQTGQRLDSPGIILQQFPTPCHIYDVYLKILSAYMLPVMITIAWLAAIAVATKNLVYDRENAQEETLKMMGLNSSLNWWAWFIFTMMIMFIVSVIGLAVMRIGNLFIFSNFGILLLYFLVYCFASTMMCYMITSFFTKRTLAVISVIIIFLLSYIPYIVLLSLGVEMKTWQKVLACLSSSSAFGFSAEYLSRQEVRMEGMQWSNIDESLVDGDSFSFKWTCIMMLIDGFIYLLIGWYVRNVKAGKFGISQPWCFPLLPSYWGCSGSKKSFKYLSEASDPSMFEVVPGSMVVGFSLRNLSKKYGSHAVVKNVNADFYEGQVTALLGHNGAAKTTTLHMMSGILQPTSGHVDIYGKSTGAKKLGICTQHNALFNYMTVEEHMEFFGAIKSDMDKKSLKLEIEELLHDVDLWHVRHVKADQLSGGMARRLGVALAFVGGSEAIILDEPTSGIDPSARRSVWNLLNKKKNQCTIVLSTHHLEEADSVGDRVAIMHNGTVLCCGSTTFLKRKFGNGYHLCITKQENTSTTNIVQDIKTLIPSIDVTEDIGSELTLALPASSDRLIQGLEFLEQNSRDMGIVSFGIFDTTMEEVFMKACKLADQDLAINEDNIKKVSLQGFHSLDDVSQVDMNGSRSTLPIFEGSSTINLHHTSDVKHQTGASSQNKLDQFFALLTKRFHHFRRNWRLAFILVVMPLLFILASLGFMILKPNEKEAKSLLLTPPMYGPNSFMFFKNTLHSATSDSLQKHLQSPPGVGTTCMEGMGFGEPFTCVSAGKYTLAQNPNSGEQTCTCNSYHHECTDAAKGIQVPQMVTNTTDILQNIGDLDTTDYLLKTFDTYRERRYGGWAFEAGDDTTDLKVRLWFNNRGYHALPAFYNGISNAILRSTAETYNTGVPSEYGISAYNHPFVLGRQQLNQDTLINAAADMGISLVLLLAFSFIPVSLMIYVIREHSCKERQLQAVSGVGSTLYWLSTFVWDLIVYSLMVALTVIIMAIFRGDAYWARENLDAVVVLLFLYGWATLPWMYCVIRRFSDPTLGFICLFCVNVLAGIISSVIFLSLAYFSSYLNRSVYTDTPASGESAITKAYEVMHYVFMVLPQFCLCNGIVDISSNQIQSDIMSRFGQDTYKHPLSFDVIGWHSLALAIEGFVFFVALAILNNRRASYDRKTIPNDYQEGESDEVKNEAERIHAKKCSDDVLVVSDLSKVYKQQRHKRLVAVDHLSFGVHTGECFGLLGVNGAGKTTTFKMITGDILPSDGAAFINKKRVKQGQSDLGREMGYCPQENSLDDYLTARELLFCHAKLRGIHPDARKTAVENLINQLDMSEFADKTVKTYSGGMKRKLSVAISLLGEPSLVFMDEPTTGMDPVAKRHVWNCVINAIKKNQSILLTSHSMDECEALCTRLAIMVNGEFKCLGSPQFLKDKYGDGYTVTLFTSGLSANVVLIHELIQQIFPGAGIRTNKFGLLVLEIPKYSASVATIFRVLEENKEKLNVLYYSVSQTTLNNVFLNFAKDQNDGLSTDYGTDSASGSGSSNIESKETSHVVSNQLYAFANEGYDVEKPAYDTASDDLFQHKTSLPVYNPNYNNQDFFYSTKF